VNGYCSSCIDLLSDRYDVLQLTGAEQTLEAFRFFVSHIIPPQQFLTQNVRNLTFSTIRYMKPIRILLTAMAASLILLIAGCGGGGGNDDEDKSPHPPSPDSPRTYQGKGTPLLFLGGGSNRGTVGSDDPEYQDYLLWKEWQQYQKYQQWLRLNEKEPKSPGTESESQ